MMKEDYFMNDVVEEVNDGDEAEPVDVVETHTEIESQQAVQVTLAMLPQNQEEIDVDGNLHVEDEDDDGDAWATAGGGCLVEEEDGRGAERGRRGQVVEDR